MASDEEQTIKDRAYSPATEREQEVRNAPGGQDSLAKEDPDIDADAVHLLPGTGGPDDQGDVDVPDEEFSLNGRPFPGHPGSGG
ncbi:hypothetical protein [Naasia aerilata]|uniref:Uncharacterized protein n=1 Tax=Naasia aerilata TaxID=1162966 RepID=A0ABN6XS52_9MICO|nr:hypothetical protein [Naasia aerilata]BDZ46425.1 hypothetical protein GCM10025866_23340 [Naasia aerilata]